MYRDACYRMTVQFYMFSRDPEEKNVRPSERCALRPRAIGRHAHPSNLASMKKPRTAGPLRSNFLLAVKVLRLDVSTSCAHGNEQFSAAVCSATIGVLPDWRHCRAAHATIEQGFASRYEANFAVRREEGCLEHDKSPLGVVICIGTNLPSLQSAVNSLCVHRRGDGENANHAAAFKSNGKQVENLKQLSSIGTY